MKQKSKYLIQIIAMVACVSAMILLLMFLFRRADSDDNRPAAVDSAPSETGAPLPQKGGETTEVTSSPLEPDEPFEPYGSVPQTEELPWNSTAGSGRTASSYANDTIISWKYQEDKTISAGVNNGSLKDALYLNIHCSETMDGNETGYYLSASSGILEYSRGFVGNIDDEENAAFTSFVIPDRLLNRVRATHFLSHTDYGVRWTEAFSGANEEQNAVIHIRAVNLRTGELICVSDLHIEYDTSSGVYFFSGLTSADVSETGELGRDLRAEIVNRAISFAENTLGVSVDDAEADSDSEKTLDWRETARSSAVVDKVSRPYYNKVLTVDGRTASFLNDFSACKDTFAVSFSVPVYGCVTVYFAPWYELHNMDAAFTGEGEMQSLEPYAYDPLLPYSEKSILVPHDGEWDRYLSAYDGAY